MNVIEIILTLAIMVAIGYILKNRDILRENNVGLLNKLVVYIFLPCFAFLAIYQSDSSHFLSFTFLPLLNIIIALILGFTTYVLLRSFNMTKRNLWAVVVSVVMMNSGFFGFPLCFGLYGNQGLARASFFDIATPLFFMCFSIIFLHEFNEKETYMDIFKKIVRFPLLIAIILGIVLNILDIPIGFISQTLSYLGSATVPLIMIVLGASIDVKAIRLHIKKASYVTLMRLVIAPLLAVLFVAPLLGLNGLNYSVAILEVSLPSAILPLTLGIEHKLNTNIITAAICLSTIVSLITIPIISIILL